MFIEALFSIHTLCIVASQSGIENMWSVLKISNALSVLREMLSNV